MIANATAAIATALIPTTLAAYRWPPHALIARPVVERIHGDG